MNFELHKFKKISDSPKSAVLQHPEGHKITIAKNVLSPQLKQQLDKLPMHLADGTPDSPIPSNEAAAEEQANAQDPNFHTDMPDAKPAQMAQADQANQPQAPVTINIGSPQAQQPTTQEPTKNDVPNYVSNGNFDFNKFILNNPNAPLESKINVLKQMDAQEQNQKNVAAQQGQQSAQQATEYNQLAAKRGLPLMNVPSQMNGAVADASADAMMPSNAQAQAPAAPQGPSDPYGTDLYQKTYEQGIGDVKEGLQKGAEAEGALGTEQAGILNNQMQVQQQNAKNYQDHYGELEQERKAFQNDIMNHHIDPQHYLNSMGTGQKIATGIGLILGGMGGGLTHQGNPALDFLNKQISNDIDSQRINLGKSENLLSANMRQFGNLRDAIDMTRIMQGDIVKNQLAQAAAKAQDPIAKSRALKEIGNLEMQNASSVSQMAMRKTLLSNISQGSSSNKLGDTSQTAQLINYLRMANPELAKNYEARFVPGVGLAQVPIAEKPREELVTRQNLDNALNDLNKYAENNSGSLDPAIISEGRSKANLVQDLYRRANGQGVFREAEKEFVGSIIGEDPTKFFKDWRTQPRYKAAIQDNVNQLNGLKQSYGLPVPYRPSSASPYRGKLVASEK